MPVYNIELNVEMKTLENDKELFEKWLIDHMGYSNKVAKDCYSRCKRIEKEIGRNLLKSVSTKKKFEELINSIQKFSLTRFNNKKSAYSFAATPISTARRYVLFKYPSKAKNYKPAYDRSNY